MSRAKGPQGALASNRAHQSFAGRVDAIHDSLWRTRNHYDGEAGRFDSKYDVKLAAKLLIEIEDRVDEMAAIFERPQVAELTDAGKLATLVPAIEAVAKAKGSALLLPDAFLELVLERMEPKQRPHWENRDSHLLGWVLSRPTLVAELKSRDVMLWSDPNERVRHVRIVHTERLTEPADVHAFVTAAVHGSGHCRFCGIGEPVPSTAFMEVEPEAAVLGSKKPRLQTRRVYVHPQCFDHWVRLRDLAEAYAATPTPLLKESHA